MSGDYVVDASVAAKLFFFEDGSDHAAATIRDAERLIAPDLLFIEMASIAAKNVRRGTSSQGEAARAVNSLTAFLDELVPARELAFRAFELATVHGFSAYDGIYIALAEQRLFVVLTADVKMARRAAEAGLSRFVQVLGDTG